MISLRPAKSVQGEVKLPISPDLLFMAALGACAAKRNAVISDVDESDVISDIIRALHGHASVELNDSTMQISPLSSAGGDDPAILLTLPESLLPYRMIYLFMGLGMGKTVTVKSISSKQTEDIIAQAKRVGITLETVELGQSAMTGLRATNFDSGVAEGCYPTEDNCTALLAFLFGKGEKLAFTIADYHLSTPLRQLANIFGFTVNAKLTATDDPLAKRMRFLKGKQREQQTQSIIYTIEADFCRREDSSGALNITIPGDEILAAALIALKRLIPKGNLEISNVPLETWASQTIAFVKKMGGKPDIRNSGKTSFGLCGIVSVPKSEYFGRKTRCVPLYQYIGQLPCMAIIAAFAEGKSVFRELEALRLSEPDGLDQLEKCLRPLGVRHGEMPDGIVVEGAKEFDGFDILEPLPAHIAVAFYVAGLRCMGKTSIADDYIFARWPSLEKMINEICEFRNK
ncbi:MAG: hypothetical protein LBU70_01255 [Chitinispirillales bacterium]|jgi:5-enolpyruvylshikimate-3-phosphate synthase|nr:hypothetical protein [Chitinispirillales bacterium]